MADVTLDSTTRRAAGLVVGVLNRVTVPRKEATKADDETPPVDAKPEGNSSTGGNEASGDTEMVTTGGWSNTMGGSTGDANTTGGDDDFPPATGHTNTGNGTPSAGDQLDDETPTDAEAWFPHRAENGWSVPAKCLSAIEDARADVPREPELNWSRWGERYGWVYYTKSSDPSDFTSKVVADYADHMGYAKGSQDRRVVEGFEIFSALESGLSSIQSYDTMGVTVGCGYAIGHASGGEGRIVAARIASAGGALAKRLKRCGLWFEDTGSKKIRVSVVDTKTKKVVCGIIGKPEGETAMDAFRGHTESHALSSGAPPRERAVLLDLIIDCARHKDTRLLYAGAVFGRLVELMRGGDYAGLSKVSSKVQSKALFGFLGHVNHWGSGKAGSTVGGVVWLANQEFEKLNGDLKPGPARDEKFAVLFHDLCLSSWFKEKTGYSLKKANFEGHQCRILSEHAKKEGLTLPAWK